MRTFPTCKSEVPTARSPWVSAGDAMSDAIIALDERIGCGCGGDYGICNSCSKAASQGEKAVAAWRALEKLTGSTGSAQPETPKP